MGRVKYKLLNASNVAKNRLTCTNKWMNDDLGGSKHYLCC